ncbi:MAG TPA: S41 family peptidase [Cyclobacteriaceae bacterium]|nr:S41 family peptidase [Cyclobacteriaceae bacterium]
MLHKTIFGLAVALILTATSFAQSPKPINVKVLIDSLDRALFKTYIFPEKSKIMSDYLKQQLKKGAYKNIKDPKALAAKIEGDIQSVHHDGHLRLHYDPRFPKVPPPIRQNTEIDTVALRSEKYNNFGFRTSEILNGNIGYVRFNGFSGMVEASKPTIVSAFRFVSNTNALIIDVRGNGGGSPWMVKYICSFFYKERTRLNDIYDRRADKTMEFWADPADAENMKLSMPVYILTSKRTFSAAEDFTYAMQTNKRAVIVGDTTGGGAHPTGPVYVGQDIVIDIPFARSINHITKTDWEGTGVRPDVPVAADEALKKAQEVFFRAQLATAKSENDKNVAQWCIDALNAHENYGQDLTTTVLGKYEGSYGRFKVYLKDDALYLDDFIGRTFRLKPISQSLFLGDDWFQVAFYSENGKDKMKMSGKPGWVDVMDKE